MSNEEEKKEQSKLKDAGIFLICLLAVAASQSLAHVLFRIF